MLLDVPKQKPTKSKENKPKVNAKFKEEKNNESEMEVDFPNEPSTNLNLINLSTKENLKENEENSKNQPTTIPLRASTSTSISSSSIASNFNSLSLSLGSKSSIYFEENMNTSSKFDFMNKMVSYTEDDPKVKLFCEYLEDIYHNLLSEEKENSNLIFPNDFLKKIQAQVNEKVRAILVDWLIEIQINVLHYGETTLFFTIKIIDHYLSKKNIPIEKFQLLGIGALLIACKHEEVKIPTLQDFCYLTDNAYTKEQLVEMENEILKVIEFQILCPTAFDFYSILSKAFSLSTKAYYFGLFFMETFLVDAEFNTIPPSMLACCCMYITMKYFNFPNYKLAYSQCLIPEYNNNLVKDLAQYLCFYVQGFIKAKQLKSSITKFATEKYENVSFLFLQ